MLLKQRKDPIDSHTRLVGLIGYPARPWPMPVMYNAAFDALDLNWRYVPLPVSGGQLREALIGLRALGFAGAQVATHYQRDVLDHLDELSPAAETIGAANLIQVDARGRLLGDNTHWHGFLNILRTVSPSLDGLRPLVIGAGDAARSIVYALSCQGLAVTILDQHINQAIDLVHRLRHALDEHSFSVYRWPDDLGQAAADANLIINTIDAGIGYDANNFVWPSDLPFPPDAVVFDLACQLDETLFLRQARAGGRRVVGGFQLLVYEAALAFEKWTGRIPPYEVMFEAAGQMPTEETTRDTTWARDWQRLVQF